MCMSTPRATHGPRPRPREFAIPGSFLDVLLGDDADHRRGRQFSFGGTPRMEQRKCLRKPDGSQAQVSHSRGPDDDPLAPGTFSRPFHFNPSFDLCAVCAQSRVKRFNCPTFAPTLTTQI